MGKTKQKIKQAFMRPVGKTLGLGIMATWTKLFEENEACKRTERSTDKQLRDFMKKEFPRRDSEVITQPQVVRCRYNRGLLTRGRMPTLRSRAYGETGIEVPVHHGRPRNSDRTPSRSVS